MGHNVPHHFEPKRFMKPDQCRSPTAAAQYDYPGHQFKRDSGSYSLFSNESDIEIELDELAFHERIGSGSFGEVWQGYWHGNCAIKILKLADPTEEQINTWRNEVEILRHTRHERILLFMGVCAQPPKLALAEGMEYLHARGLLHNDLKSHNILLNKDFDAKIADFGLSMLKRDNRLAKGVQGSAHWLAPEIVRMADRDTPYSEKSDVWAFGMILYELIASRLPYSDLVGEQILWQIGSQKLPSMDEVREDTPADLKQLMANCWELRPQDRKSFDVILQNLVHMQTKLNFSMRRTQSLQNVRDRSWSLGSNSPGNASVHSPIPSVHHIRMSLVMHTS
ncbi:hypothetical protein BZG36_04593 [Bifiguratus adelaidae]|uniref:Protein kinase domain-containing protein n=1 Tax=Bifiguratus adelaidae TaxID=1938954 RepID=A0A261XVH6_9FUNG|nr:hypothetical protein BZG36_04593 [Bifiguratus adelaidae]